MSPRRRRSRRSFALTASLLTALTLVSSAASAQVLFSEPRRRQSPQNFALELRFGPYLPEVDAEFARTSGRTPYKNFFGADRDLMMQIEFDYQFFRHFGSLAAGVGVGYFSVSGAAPAADGSGLTGDTSSFTIVPLFTSLVYRFDWVYERTRIPLVPYAKGGLAYGLWWVRDGNGEIASDGRGGVGRGGTLGWHGALGVSLVLDFLDPSAARGFDIDMGVNHTHLFFELTRFDLSGLGRPGQLHIGDNTWFAGLLFEF